jgi:hypothetical protein
MKKNECELYSEFHRKDNKPHDKFSFRKEDMQKEVKKDEEEEDSVCLCNKTKVTTTNSLEVQEDWYFITFAGYNIEVILKKELAPSEIKLNMQSCYFIFGVQSVLIFFVALKFFDPSYFV